jgi:hypothetical protein
MRVVRGVLEPDFRRGYPEMPQGSSMTALRSPSPANTWSPHRFDLLRLSKRGDSKLRSDSTENWLELCVPFICCCTGLPTRERRRLLIPRFPLAAYHTRQIWPNS